ncbi:response regulator receiver domain [Sulfuricurvum sp.]|uniref:response regulator receiver domain n=1 Tax=Sulfuricurvum sp. TaxID=2025608 RepID=UPI003C4CCDCE
MSRFLEISKGIVEDFLQTAVFLDDRAFFPNENGTNGIAFSSTTEIEDPVTGEITTIPTPQVSEQNEHDLNAKTIIDTFMQKGIVCSVIKCEESTFDAQRSNYLKLMKKADIIVLDWDLFSDGGEKIVGIIKDLMSADEQLHELRSIVVYTANDLETVKARFETEGLTFEDYLSHNKRYTAISLWNKNSSIISSDRKANFTEIVDKCIDEFTETFHGIVPNVAMAAIAEVRKNTHKFLGKLNQSLDPAYLSHRSLLETPDEAEEHLEEIIIDEIDSILKTNKVGENAKFEIIQHANILQNKTYRSKDFKKCIENGTEKEYIKGKNTTQKKADLAADVKECFTSKWFDNVELSNKSETDYAVISSQISNYGKPSHLTLGVIVEFENNKYLCLQPRCDSVRLKRKTEFIFVKLTPDENIFDVILNDGSKFKLQYGLKNRQYFSFTPNENNKVMFSDFKNIQETKEFKYITTLKKSHAQRIANEFSAYISRIGLNESEYIRRNSPRTLAGKL